MDVLRQILSGSLLVIGTMFSFLAAVGILRMPEFYTRAHAATKAATLGVSCLVLAASLEFEPAGVTMRALLIVVFLFATAPVAAHMLGRAAHASGVPQWEHSVVDEMEAFAGRTASDSPVSDRES